MNKLVIANLLHRPLRSLISVFAVAIEVIMMLTIIAIMMGQLTGQKRMNNGIGANLTVRPGNAMFLNGVSGAPISAKLAPVLGKLPHVTVASPVITNLSMSDGLEVLWGIDWASYSQLSPFVFLSGGPMQGPDDVIVDDVFASTGKGHHVGETILILKHPFRIAGIFEHGKGGRKLVPIATLGELMGSEGKASVFYLKADRPENLNAIMDEIHAVRGLENYQVMTMDEWYSLMTPDHIPALEYRHARGHRNRGHHRLPGHLPVDVHLGAGAYARDRHSEVDGRFQAVHRHGCFARDRGCWLSPASWWAWRFRSP